MTPEDRIRMARGGAIIQPPITVEDAEARYRAAGMDPEAARVIASGEARIHGDGAQGIWSESPSVESLDRVRGVRSRQGAIDREAQAATAEPFVGRGLPVPGQAAPDGSLPADRAVGTQRLLAQQDQKRAETSARMADEAKSWGEWDKRQAAKQKDRNTQIAAMTPEEREAYADRVIGRDKYRNPVIPGNQNQFGISDRERTVDRDRVLTQAWQRYGKASGLDYEDFEAAYDSALRQTGSHGRATQALARLASPAKADLARKNFETGRQRAKDYNLARETGRPIGDIMFQNDLANQRGNPAGERAVLVGQHVSRPGLGLGNLAGIGLKGEQDLAAVQAAGGNRNRNPIERMREGASEVRGAPPEDKIMAARTHIRGMNPGGQVDIQTENQGVVQMLAGDAAQVALNPTPTPDEYRLLQQWTMAHMGSGLGGSTPAGRYKDWCRQLGVPENDWSKKVYAQVSGEYGHLSLLERGWNRLFGPSSDVSAPPSAVAAPPQAGAAAAPQDPASPGQG